MAERQNFEPRYRHVVGTTNQPAPQLMIYFRCDGCGGSDVADAYRGIVFCEGPPEKRHYKKVMRAISIVEQGVDDVI